jgi:hypothetical protein
MVPIKKHIPKKRMSGYDLREDLCDAAYNLADELHLSLAQVHADALSSWLVSHGADVKAGLSEGEAYQKNRWLKIRQEDREKEASKLNEIASQQEKEARNPNETISQQVEEEV